MTQPAPAPAIFATEAALVDSFVGALRAHRAFGHVQVTTEWNHKAGLVDVLVRDAANSLIAFEAKLRDWKRAFMQAYRNTAYANKAYVLLPESAAQAAMKHREEFELRGIGLCAMTGDGVQVLIDAAEQEPLLRWVRSLAHEHFDTTVPGDEHLQSKNSGGRARRLQRARV
jgi:hypothetical protein